MKLPDVRPLDKIDGSYRYMILNALPSVCSYLSDCVTPKGREEETLVEIEIKAKNGTRNYSMSFYFPYDCFSGFDHIEHPDIPRASTVLQMLMPQKLLDEEQSEIVVTSDTDNVESENNA